jgi:multiple sugar transport system permease protein
MRSRGGAARAGMIVLTIVVVLGAVVMFFPFVWTVVTSIDHDAGLDVTPSLVPDHPSLGAYLELFSRLPFRGRGIAFAAYLATMMMPIQVLIVPLFVEMKTFGLLDSYVGVILPSIGSAFGVFLLRQAMNSVPTELDQAATLDGAGHFRIFAQIVLPLIRPALATFGVFAFLNSWNAFLWPLIILRSPELHTLPVALSSLQGQYTTQWDVVMAGSVISILPMVVLYVFAQKYIVQGVAGAGLK